MLQQPLHRYVTFRYPHQNMRLQLCELQIKMLQTQFPSAAADDLLSHLEETLSFCESVTQKEEAFVLNQLRNKAAAIVADLQDDHAQEEDLIARLQYLIKRWRQHGQASDANAILLGLGDFTAFKFTHLNREERELMPILWQHFSDQELEEMEQLSGSPSLQVA